MNPSPTGVSVTGVGEGFIPSWHPDGNLPNRGFDTPPSCAYYSGMKIVSHAVGRTGR
jgi:hypothetical protein